MNKKNREVGVFQLSNGWLVNLPLDSDYKTTLRKMEEAIAKKDKEKASRSNNQ